MIKKIYKNFNLNLQRALQRIYWQNRMHAYFVASITSQLLHQILHQFQMDHE